MKVEELQALVEGLTVASKDLSKKEVRQTELLGTVCMAYLDCQVNAFIARNRDRPFLYSYKSDAWSALWNEVVVEQLGDCVVRRSGKMLHEFLMERAFLKAYADSGPPEMLMLFGAPRGLANGKGANHCFKAGCEFRSMLPPYRNLILQ